MQFYSCKGSSKQNRCSDFQHHSRIKAVGIQSSHPSEPNNSRDTLKVKGATMHPSKHYLPLALGLLGHPAGKQDNNSRKW